MTNRLTIPTIAMAAVFASVCPQLASASLIVYSGFDLIPTANPPAVHPNSTAAAASFDAAVAGLGGASIITFESATIGSYSNLTVAPGVFISGTDSSGANQKILNATNFPSYPSVDGFNTTAGGIVFAELQGGSVTFTFAKPVQFFGAYFSGIQTNFYPDALMFSDGTSQTVSFPGTGTSNNVGALDFVGFTDAGKSISSITIVAGLPGTGQDFIGFDDVRIPNSVPEPGSWGLMLMGCVGIGLGWKVRTGARKACRGLGGSVGPSGVLPRA